MGGGYYFLARTQKLKPSTLKANMFIDFNSLVHLFKTNYECRQVITRHLIECHGVPNYYQMWRVILGLPELLIYLTVEDMHNLSLACRATNFGLKASNLYVKIKAAKATGAMGTFHKDIYLHAWYKRQQCKYNPFLPCFVSGTGLNNSHLMPCGYHQRHTPSPIPSNSWLKRLTDTLGTGPRPNVCYASHSEHNQHSPPLINIYDNVGEKIEGDHKAGDDIYEVIIKHCIRKSLPYFNASYYIHFHAHQAQTRTRRPKIFEVCVLHENLLIDNELKQSTDAVLIEIARAFPSSIPGL